MYKKVLLSVIFCSCISLCIASEKDIKTFSDAKSKVKEIYKNNRITFYCGCKYDNHLNVNLKSCNYTVRKNKKRASKIEFEHIVPAENFGKQMKSKCWIEPICTKKNGEKYKGRNCCLAIDPEFIKMHNDLYNLVPAIGEINGDRKNYKFSILEKSDFIYGSCDFKIDFKNKAVEPSDKTKGLIARTYLYYQKKYGLNLSRQQERMFRYWDKTYPADSWELIRNSQIEKIQGKK